MPEGTQLPRSWNLKLYARWAGGVSYDSCAVVCRDSLPVNVPDDVGSNRCILVEILDGLAQPALYVIVVYMPTHGSKELDNEWIAQLSIVESVLKRVIHKQAPYRSVCAYWGL